MPAETTSTSHEAGSVALLALWSVAIIGFLLAAATVTTRSELHATRNSLAAAHARLAAEAGIQLGLARLLRRRVEGAALFDGQPERWRDGAITVDIAIHDEAGKIDLNEAPFELLSGLLLAIGQRREAAVLLACNILERRGTAGAPCAEPDEPEDRPRRQPQRFAVEEELAQVPGVDDALYAAIADNITVATRASAVDPLVAPRAVLLAIPGATPALVDAFLDSRTRWRDIGAADRGVGLAQARGFMMTSPGREFTISAVATTPEHARYRADLLIRLTDLGTRPYEILAARAPPPDRSGASPGQRRVP